MKSIFLAAAVAVLAVSTVAFAPAIGRDIAAPAPQTVQPAPRAEAPATNKGATGAICLGTLLFICTGMLNVRTLQDANLQVTTALPAANATATSATIDTAEVNPGRLQDVELFLSLPATPSLTNTDTITLTFYHSADNNADFVAVPDIPPQTVTAGGGGGAALNYQCALPIGLLRYVQVQASVPNGGGNNTAVSFTWGFVF